MARIMLNRSALRQARWSEFTPRFLFGGIVAVLVWRTRKLWGRHGAEFPPSGYAGRPGSRAELTSASAASLAPPWDAAAAPRCAVTPDTRPSTRNTSVPADLRRPPASCDFRSEARAPACESLPYPGE